MPATRSSAAAAASAEPILSRRDAAGWLAAQKQGRRARWQLTGDARQLLTDGAGRIYSFAGPARDWDDRWLLVFVRIPESDRRVRHVMRSRLSWAGFGSLGPGVWVVVEEEYRMFLGRVRRPRPRGCPDQADRAGPRLAAVPVDRTRPAARAAAGPPERARGGPALHRPARAVDRRRAAGMGTAQ